MKSSVLEIIIFLKVSVDGTGTFFSECVNLNFVTVIFIRKTHEQKSFCVMKRTRFDVKKKSIRIKEFESVHIKKNSIPYGTEEYEAYV